MFKITQGDCNTDWCLLSRWKYANHLLNEPFNFPQFNIYHYLFNSYFNNWLDICVSGLGYEHLYRPILQRYLLTISYKIRVKIHCWVSIIAKTFHYYLFLYCISYRNSKKKNIWMVNHTNYKTALINYYKYWMIIHTKTTKIVYFVW